MKTHIYFLYFCLLTFTSSAAMAQEMDERECWNKYAKVDLTIDKKERFNKLKEVAEECPKYTNVLISLADALMEMRTEAADDWLQQALTYSRQAVQVDSTRMMAHWYLAQALEYIGEYKQATLQYQWVMDFGDSLDKVAHESKKSKVWGDITKDFEAKHKAEARVHAITCRFLAENMKAKKKPTVQTEAHKAESVDISNEAIKERSGWSFLKELVASVAVAGGLTALQGDGQHIQHALRLLYEWTDAPKGQEVIARNNFLAGMVSTLVTIIAEKKLDVKLATIYDPTKGKEMPVELPEPNYGGEMEKDFKNQSSTEGRTFDISDDLTITEKWSVQNISGEYECVSLSPPIQGGCERSGTRTFTIPGIPYARIPSSTVTQTKTPLIVKQQGNLITTRHESVTQEANNPNDVYKMRTITTGEGYLAGNTVDMIVTSTSETRGVRGQPFSGRTKLKILSNGDLQFTSVGTDGVTYTSAYSRKQLKR